MNWLRLARSIWNKRIRLRFDNLKLSYKIELLENSLFFIVKSYCEKLEIKCKENHKLSEEVKKGIEKIKILEHDYEQVKERSIMLKYYASFDILKNLWLDVWVEKLANSYYGCGSIYELYIERKQEKTGAFLSLNEGYLSHDEVERIKKETQYIEDFEPYNEADEEAEKYDD